MNGWCAVNVLYSMLICYIVIIETQTCVLHVTCPCRHITMSSIDAAYDGYYSRRWKVYSFMVSWLEFKWTGTILCPHVPDGLVLLNTRLRYRSVADEESLHWRSRWVKQSITGNKTQVLEIIKLSSPSYMNRLSLCFSGGLTHRESDLCSGLYIPHLGPRAHPEGWRHILPLSGELLDQHGGKRMSNWRSEIFKMCFYYNSFIPHQI